MSAPTFNRVRVTNPNLMASTLVAVQDALSANQPEATFRSFSRWGEYRQAQGGNGIEARYLAATPVTA